MRDHRAKVPIKRLGGNSSRRGSQLESGYGAVPLKEGSLGRLAAATLLLPPSLSNSNWRRPRPQRQDPKAPQTRH